MFHGRRPIVGVGVLSMLEATILPVPLELILVPLMAARRHLIWRLAGAATLGCVLAAIFGYAVGWALMESVGEPLLRSAGYHDEFERIRRDLGGGGGFWIIFTIGVTPIPFQSAMLAAGASGYSFPAFVLAATMARSLRYFGLAALVWLVGERAQRLWESHSATIALTVAGLLVIYLLWQL